jgi:hypothetical protein
MKQLLWILPVDQLSQCLGTVRQISPGWRDGRIVGHMKKECWFDSGCGCTLVAAYFYALVFEPHLVFDDSVPHHNHQNHSNQRRRDRILIEFISRMRECPLFADMRLSSLLLMMLVFLALLTSPISSIVHPDDRCVGGQNPRVISQP